ncbi:hypothetical protein [Paracoccus contaminans]|nr:hypothetical protein [Paracoccus contaminans]
MIPAPRPSRARRGWAWLAAAILAAAGGAGAWLAGQSAAAWVESRTAGAARAALAEGGFGWADVTADGLALRLEGTAPDENARLHALAAVARRVPLARLDDGVAVRNARAGEAPAFRLEILRSAEGVSVAGLVPAAPGGAALGARLGQATGTPARTDLVEPAGSPAPPGWNEAVAFAIKAAGLAPRARLSVLPGRVTITALADSAGEKERIGSALRKAVPPGVALILDVSTPLPVIAPFALDLVRANGATRLAACAADSAAAQQRILAALGAADAACPVGLGAPSPRWADAAVAVIDALGTLPEGRAAIRDKAVTMQAPASVPAEVFGAARDRLAATLPPGFALSAAQDAPAAAAPVRFDAIAAGTRLRLRGAVADERTRAAVESLARAQFGHVDSLLAVNPAAPAGWTVRVIGALEAMRSLQEASVAVTPDDLRIAGTTGSRTAARDIAAELGRRMGPGVPYRLALTYDPRLDPALDMPSGPGCVARLNEAAAQAEIGFQPASAAIAGDTGPALAALAGAMQGCGDYRIELAFYAATPEAGAMALSQKRADAVLAAMSKAGIDTANLGAMGYGPADHGTGGEGDGAEEGEDDAGPDNPRIAFRLLSSAPVGGPAPPVVTRGVTEAQPAGGGEAAAAGAGAVPLVDRLSGPPPALGPPSPKQPR